MSSMPSTARPPRSFAEAIEQASASPVEARAIVSAGELLAARGVFGLAWIDRSLIVSRSYGRLIEFVQPGVPVTESVVPLVGMEEEIGLLATEPGRVLEIPSVWIRVPRAPGARLNLALIWSARDEHYLLLVSRTGPTSELEMQLAGQIRGRLMAERDATALARQLARTNHDLEEFTSIISHDLSTPLRAMRYLVEDAEAALRTGDVDMARLELVRVREQSQRLSGMLNGLFDYARAAHKDEVAAHVDLRALAVSIVQSFPRRDGLTIEMEGAWPALETLAAPLALVLRNLIDNAIKHHDRDQIRIVLRAEIDGESLVLTVADDGPGIDPKYHEAILRPFHRLEASSGREGTGMGLALVKRAVEGVGGRLEILSSPPQRRGATFKVQWPTSVQG